MMLKEAKKKDAEDEKKFELLKKRIRELDLQNAVQRKIMTEQTKMMQWSDFKLQLENIKNLIEMFFRTHFTIKELPLIHELQGQVEDLIMNPDDKEKRQI